MVVYEFLYFVVVLRFLTVVFFGADRHTVGVPFASGYKECVAYFESIGVQDWKLVDRLRVCRCIPFIASG